MVGRIGVVSCALCLVTYFFADPVSCVYGYTWVYKLPEDYRDYLTVMYGLFTGIKGITRGKLPYLPGNFQVNTKISKVFYFIVTRYRVIGNQGGNRIQRGYEGELGPRLYQRRWVQGIRRDRVNEGIRDKGVKGDKRRWDKESRGGRG